MNEILEIKGLKKEYSSFTLSIPTLKVPKGLIVGFVGENGAGKTTTIKSIFSLIKKDCGEILFDGKNIDTMNFKEREKIALCFDECTLPPRFTLSSLSRYGKMLYSSWNDEKWNELVQKLSLPQNQLIKDFSKGTKAKAQLAFTLSHNPSLLVLDEVTSSMDPVIRDEVLTLLQEFIMDGNNTVFLSSHLTSDLEKVADLIIFIHKGKIALTLDRDNFEQNYAIVKANGKIENEGHIISSIKRKYSHDYLIDNKEEFMRINPELVIDKACIEDILLFISKGDN